MYISLNKTHSGFVELAMCEGLNSGGLGIGYIN
jgi:hypothetical protein